MITVEKALLYSAGQGHEPTEGATVAHRGQTVCVCTAVCVTTEQGQGLTQKHMYTR